MAYVQATQLKSVRVTRLKRRSFPGRPLRRASHHVHSHRKTVRQASNDCYHHQQSLDVTAVHDRKYFSTSGPCCWSRAAPFCYFRSIRHARSVTVRDGRGKGPLYVRSDRTRPDARPFCRQLLVFSNQPLSRLL